MIAILFLSSCGLKPIFVEEPTDHPGDQLFADAEELFNIRSYDRAFEVFGAYLAQHPRRHLAPDALMRMSSIHMLQGRSGDARHTYDRLIEHFPESPRVPDARIAILDTYYQEGNFAEVVQRGAKVLKHLETKAHLFRLYRLLGDTYRAASFLLGAVESYGKAYTYGESDERRALGETLETIVAQLDSPDIPGLLNRMEEGVPRGYLLYQLGKNHAKTDTIGKALEQLTKFIKNNPNHPMVPAARQLLSELEKESTYKRHVIGCLLPLTGRYGAFGQKALMGVELALARYNADPAHPPITIIIKDTGSKEDGAVQAAGELADERVTAIIGPIVSAEDAVMLAQREQIPIVTLNQKQDITKLGDYVFRNFITAEMQAEAIVSHAVETLGLRRFAILYPDEPYGRTFMNRIWDAMLVHGGTVVGVEFYDPSLTDFADPIQKLIGRYYAIPEDLKENDYRFIHIDESLAALDPIFSESLKALLKRVEDLAGRTPLPTMVFEQEEEDPEEELEPFVDFDAIIIPDASKSAGLIIPQLAFFDIENVYLFGTNLWHSDTLIEMAKDYVQGAILPEGFFAQSRSNRVIDFVRPFEEVYGQSPEFIEAVAYDTARILFGIAGNPDIRFRQSFRDEILKLHDFPGVTGLSSCDSTGDIQKQLYLLRIKGKRFVEVSP